MATDRLRQFAIFALFALAVPAGAQGAESPAVSRAEKPSLAMRPAGQGLYEFDTGRLRGRLKMDGRYQGLDVLVDAASGEELVHAPGVFSPYRVLITKGRFGDAARDWPTTTRLLADGAVEVRWPPAEGHPVEIVAVYRWTTAETLDMETTVRAGRALPQFELFLSSYFGKGFLASVYAQPEGQTGPRWVKMDRGPDFHGAYVMLPRDDDAARRIRDGRWTLGPSPVDWDLAHRLAAPLAVRRDARLGITAVMMARPEDCFAVSMPWNPASADAAGYRSLYLSLFGKDLAAGETAKAHCRLLLGRELSDEDAVARYRAFLNPTSPTPQRKP